jgi:hypothetical protein
LILLMQRFHGVAVLVQLRVVGDGPTARATALLAMGGLPRLLRDRRLDAAFAQVVAVGAGGVGLVGGDRVGPGAGTPAPAAHLHLGQHLLKARAVGGLSGDDHETERAAAPIGCQVRLAGQPAARTPPFGLAQPQLAAPSHPTAIGTVLGLGRGGVLVCRRRFVVDLLITPFSSSAAFSSSSSS